MIGFPTKYFRSHQHCLLKLLCEGAFKSAVRSRITLPNGFSSMAVESWSGKSSDHSACLSVSVQRAGNMITGHLFADFNFNLAFCRTMISENSGARTLAGRMFRIHFSMKANFWQTQRPEMHRRGRNRRTSLHLLSPNPHYCIDSYFCCHLQTKY
jgi:hypothetical protein